MSAHTLCYERQSKKSEDGFCTTLPQEKRNILKQYFMATKNAKYWSHELLIFNLANYALPDASNMARLRLLVNIVKIKNQLDATKYAVFIARNTLKQ
jgi:hypothetical protein